MKAKYVYTLFALGLLSFNNVFSQEAVESAEQVVRTIPNYGNNYKLFLVLATLTAFLMLAIFIVAGNIKATLRDDFYKKKFFANDNKGLMTALLIGGSLLTANNSMALSFRPEGDTKGLPWLVVENSDLVLLTILNLVLLFVLLYLRRMFQQILADANLALTKKQEKSGMKKFNRILTDAVDVEDEESIMMEDEYDGIRELDNNLPPWWVAMLYATIIFAVAYMFHYHIFKTGDLQIAEYDKKMEKAEAEVEAYLSKMAMNVDETNVTLMTDAKDLDAGKVLFDQNCVVCHADKGQGDIGPNLTDDYWIYTGDIKEIFRVIKNGTSNGMPEHSSKLNPIQTQQVSSYVWNLPSTPGKEPEGEKYTK